MSFLEILPWEIRNEIFEYVFTTNTAVRFEPINSSPPILYRLHARSWIFGTHHAATILRTCKQIHNECKDLFWKCNALCIDDVFPAFDLPDCIKSKVQAVKLTVDPLVTDKRRGCLPLKEDFIHLRTWHGLRRLGLHFVFELIGDAATGLAIADEDPLQRLLRLRHHGKPSGAPDAAPGETVYHEYLSILRAAGGEGGYFSHLERRIYIDTSSFYSKFARENGVPERVFPIDDGDPNEVLAEIACAFGGSLAVNKEVCMRDRAQVRRIFMSSFEGGCMYRDDLYKCAMANLWADCFGGEVWRAHHTVASKFEYDPDRVLEFADLPEFKNRKYLENVEDFKNYIVRLGRPGTTF